MLEYANEFRILSLYVMLSSSHNTSFGFPPALPGLSHWTHSHLYFFLSKYSFIIKLSTQSLPPLGRVSSYSKKNSKIFCLASTYDDLLNTSNRHAALMHPI